MGEGNRRLCVPQIIRREQYARPLTRLPARRTGGLSPRSSPPTVPVWCLPKNALRISISWPVSFACIARPRPPRFSSAVLQALLHSFSPSLLPACPRWNPKRTAKKEQWARGHSVCHAPQSPPKPSPAPRTLDYPNECHSDLGLHVCGRRPWLPRLGSCALLFPVTVRETEPLTQAGEHPGSPRPRSFRFLPRRRLQQNRAARGPKSGRENAFRVAQPACQLSLPNADPRNPNCNFSFPSRFPLGCSERARGR